MVDYSKELVKFTVVCEEATMSMNNFSETYKAIENRYHPLIRFIFTVLERIKW